MVRGRFLVLAAMLCVATALVAQPFPRSSRPVAAYSLLLLDNEPVYKELKLDEAQAKKAAELGKAASSRVMSALFDGKKADELTKEIEKDLAFLKADQRKRLTELTWQLLGTTPAGPSVIGGDATAAAPLKLTKEQVGRLVSREALAAVLTAEQKKTFDALKGKAADDTVVRLSPFGPGTGPGPRRRLPTVLQYLTNKAVDAELKPTKDQKEKLEALTKKWRDKNYPPFRPSEAQIKEAREVADAIEKDARALLTKDQATRLAEITLQVEKRRLSRERDLFTLAGVIEGLKLTDAQKKKLPAIVEERQKGLLALFTAAGEAKDVLDAVKKYNAETYKQLLAELTAEQNTALDGLFGKPFEGELRIAAFLPTNDEGFAPTRTLLHLFQSIRTYVGSAELHKELALTADQKKKLSDLAERRQPTEGRLDEKKRAALAAETEKELAAILKPEQMKRLGEVMLQQYERGSFPFAMASLGRFVEVRKGLELTKEQIDKLGARPDVRLDSVLTEAQKAKWKEMIGKPTEARLSRTFGLPGAFSLLPELALLQAKDVAEDVKLTAAQKEKLAGIVKTFQDATRIGPSDDFQELMKKRAAARQEAVAAVAKLLDKDQTRRLAELQLQQARQSGVYTLLTRPAVVEALKLTREQRDRISDLSDGQRALTTALHRELSSARSGGLPAEVPKAREVIHAVTERKMEAVLTKEQADKLKALLGQPFKGELPRSIFGGFGGFGGGFGGLGGGLAPRD